MSIITVIIECRFVVKLVQWDEKCLTSVAVTDDRSNDGQPLLIGVEVEALTPLLLMSTKPSPRSMPVIRLKLFRRAYLITEDCWNSFIKIPHPESATRFNVSLIYRHPVHASRGSTGTHVTGFIAVGS